MGVNPGMLGSRLWCEVMSVEPGRTKTGWLGSAPFLMLNVTMVLHCLQSSGSVHSTTRKQNIDKYDPTFEH